MHDLDLQGGRLKTFIVFGTRQALLFRTTGQRSPKDGADRLEVATGRPWDDHSESKDEFGGAR